MDENLDSDEKGQDEVQLPATWLGLDELPVLATNLAAVQHLGENEFVMSFGHLTPPLLLGTPEQKREQARALAFVAIRPVARLSLNRTRLVELIDALQRNLKTHDARFGEGGTQDDDS